MKLIKQKGSGTFLLKVSDTDENCTVCNYAIVSIDDNLKKKIATFKKTIEDLKEAGESVYTITAFDYSVTYLSECEYCDYEQISDELREELEDFMEKFEGVIEIAPLEISDDIPIIRDDCSQVIVDDYGVRFDSIVKHTDVKMYTDKIPHTDL